MRPDYCAALLLAFGGLLFGQTTPKAGAELVPGETANQSTSTSVEEAAFRLVMSRFVEAFNNLDWPAFRNSG